MIICETNNDCPCKSICLKEHKICYEVTTTEDQENGIRRLIAARKEDNKEYYCLFSC